jgi:hypothetical protein
MLRPTLSASSARPGGPAGPPGDRRHAKVLHPPPRHRDSRACAQVVQGFHGATKPCLVRGHYPYQRGVVRPAKALPRLRCPLPVTGYLQRVGLRKASRELRLRLQPGQPDGQGAGPPRIDLPGRLVIGDAGLRSGKLRLSRQPEQFSAHRPRLSGPRLHGYPLGERKRPVQQSPRVGIPAPAEDGAQDSRRVELVRRRDSRDGQHLLAEVRGLVPPPQQQQRIGLGSAQAARVEPEFTPLAEGHGLGVITLRLVQPLQADAAVVDVDVRGTGLFMQVRIQCDPKPLLNQADPILASVSQDPSQPVQGGALDARLAQACADVARLRQDGEGLILLSGVPEAVGAARIRPCPFHAFRRERFGHRYRLLSGPGRLLPLAELPQRPGQRAQIPADS